MHVEIFARVLRGAGGEKVGYYGRVHDVTAERQRDAALRVLSTGLARLTGEAFFAEVAEQLAAIVGADIGFVNTLQLGAPTTVRTRGFVVDGIAQLPFEHGLAGTPCERILAGRALIISHGVQQLFPEDEALVSLGAESYAAAPLRDSSGRIIGAIGVIARRPIVHPERVESILKLFALRTAAEVERQWTEARFAGVFEFAPDALLIVAESGRIIVDANRAAEETFGYSHRELLRLNGRGPDARDGSAPPPGTARELRPGGEPAPHGFRRADVPGAPQGRQYGAGRDRAQPTPPATRSVGRRRGPRRDDARPGGGAAPPGAEDAIAGARSRVASPMTSTTC